MHAKCLATSLAHSKYSGDNNRCGTIVTIAIMKLVSCPFKNVSGISHADLLLGYHPSSATVVPFLDYCSIPLNCLPASTLSHLFPIQQPE